MENSVIDLAIRIKNGYLARRETITVPYSRFKEEVLRKLKDLEFIKNYHVEGDKVKNITVDLLYNNSVPALTDIKIFSKPGQRFYVSYKELKPVLGGLGYSILSTPKGILTNKEAKKEKIGGELLFNVW